MFVHTITEAVASRALLFHHYTLKFYLQFLIATFQRPEPRLYSYKQHAVGANGYELWIATSFKRWWCAARSMMPKIVASGISNQSVLPVSVSCLHLISMPNNDVPFVRGCCWKKIFLHLTNFAHTVLTGRQF